MKTTKRTINSYDELLLIKQDLKKKVKSQERNVITTYLLVSKISQLIKASRRDKKSKSNKDVYGLLFPYINELTTKILDYKDKNKGKKSIINIVMLVVIAIYSTDALSRKINNLFNKKDKQKK
ncbi:MAG: hypothetical protein B6D61_03395 [Bacteroidetes bacterium 4484_249]|nr:MAG: hypothetical protein B6D61_03395 [Bacteroidetes bacterium 4484_249]